MSGNEFLVTPMNQVVELDPGQKCDLSITILNPTNSTESLEYKAYVVPYSVVSEGYDADIATRTTYTQMADWITIHEPTGKLAPNEMKELNFTIEVPENVPGGGQYAAIAVEVDHENKTHDNMAVANTLEIASVVYAKIAGETIHEGEILENNVPGFSTASPITVSSMIENKGNVHEAVRIVVTASNFFTGEVIAQEGTNNGTYAELVMPESTRYFTKEIDELPMVGVFRVKQDIYYNGAVSTVEKNVLVCPIWFMLLVALTIGTVIFEVVRTILKHKKIKQYSRRK